MAQRQLRGVGRALRSIGTHASMGRALWRILTRKANPWSAVFRWAVEAEAQRRAACVCTRPTRSREVAQGRAVLLVRSQPGRNGANCTGTCVCSSSVFIRPSCPGGRASDPAAAPRSNRGSMENRSIRNSLFDETFALASNTSICSRPRYAGDPVSSSGRQQHRATTGRAWSNHWRQR